MLYSKRVKQRERNPAAPDAFFMIRLRLALSSFVLLVVVAGCGGTSAPKSVPPDAVAVVGKDAIKKSSFDGLLAQAKHSYAALHRPFPKAGTSGYTNLRNQILQFLVERAEYEQKAKDLGVKVSDKQVSDRIDQVKKQYFGNPPGQKPATAQQMDQRYKAQLAKQGLTDKQFRDATRSQLLREGIYKKVTDKVKVSDSDVKDYYKKHKQQYIQPGLPESRDVRHILVKSHALALTIYAKLKAGGDFTKLAQKYSTDPSSKTTGGRLTVCRQQSGSCLKTVAPFERVSFALKANEISKPVRSKFGWHVIQALGPVKPASKSKAIPFDQVKDAIKQQLIGQKKQQAMTKWWDKAKKDFAKKTKYREGYAPPANSATSTG
jgi:parvulin-like peptidyl-prolyl isomerase